MFTDIKAMLDQPAVLELLSYIVFPDSDQLRAAAEQYRSNPDLQLYGLVSEGELLGLIGYERVENRVIKLRHLSVSPDLRGTGYGRGMILEMIGKEEPQEIFAETDEDAIDFYRNIGFSVASLGEVYPGVERFRCVFQPIYD